MKYYIVSDVHSYYSILRRTLDEKGFSLNKDHVLVLLGDAFDRGEETRDTAKFLLSLYDQGKLIYVLGNHEELLVKCLQQLSRGDDPIDIATSYHSINGTWQSLLAIANMTESEAVSHPQTLVANVLSSRVYKELLASCVDYFETDKYIFTHGYIPCIEKGFSPYISYSYNPDWREAATEEWYRARWYNGVKIAVESNVREEQKTIVCGHWHTSAFHAKYEKKGSEWGSDADFAPFYSEDGAVVGIDACTASSQTINCLVYDEEDL